MVLAVTGASKSFGAQQVLRGVSFELGEEEIYGLIGPNGAGKSTLFNCITGHLRLQSGAVTLRGRDITKLSPHRVCRSGVARTFQITRTYRTMSAYDNVLVSWHAAHGRFADVRWRRQREEAESALELVGLDDRGDVPAGSLPHPDRKRLELAMAFVGRPAVILLDEPTAGMSPVEREEILEAIGAVKRERPVAVLIVEHDIDMILSLCDRVGVLYYGELIVEGDPERIRRNERVREIYLGEKLDA